MSVNTSTARPDHAPRQVPRWSHAVGCALLALAFSLRLALVPVPPTLGMVLFLVAAGLFIALCLPMQLRCWGTLLAPALTPARVAVAAFSATLPFLLTSFPSEVAVPWRIAVTILMPVALYVLLRWDDTRTVELLRARARRGERPGPEGSRPTASPV